MQSLLVHYSGLIGYVMSLTPLACDLMGWRPHANEADGSASIGAYFFFGGMLMTVTGLAEVSPFVSIVFSSCFRNVHAVSLA